MTSSAASDRMGGKQEPTQANQTGKAAAQMATQEQLRLARITQEANKDEDQAIIQKAIRKVIEATRCSQSAAEIALYDADNDVGTAIMAVLDQPPTDDWHEQKSRKAKKQSSDNHDDEENRDSQRTDRRHGRSGSSAATRNGNDAPRFRSRGGGGNKVGGGRGGREFDGGDGDFQQHQGNRRDDDRGISRGRGGGGRGGGPERGRGRGRGRFGDKPGGGGAPSMGAIGTWDGGAGNSTNNQHPANETFTGAASAWDNSMAKQNNEKDMVWQNSMAGGHKRDGPTLNGGDEWSGGNDDTLNGEDTDWKNVGTLVFQRKEETEVTSTAPSFASVARLPKPSEQPPPVSTQPPQPQRTPSVGDSHSITGSATPQQQQQSAYGVRNNNAIVTSLLNQQPTSETFRAPVAASPPRNPGNATSWTQQLKNDLGIGRAPVSAAAASHVGGARQSTVEFVSDDGRDDSSALPEYQFGFHVEPTVTPQQQQQPQQHDYSSGSNSVEAVLFPTRTSKSDPVLDNVRGPTNYSQPSTAVNGSTSKEAAKISSTSIQSSYGSMQMPSVTTVTSAMKGMSMGQSSTASMAPALAYAETTTMSYPDATRNAYAINQQFMSPAATSTYAPSSNKTVTTAASKAPVANPMFNSSMQQMYNPTFPYMNLYSPVTTVRPDDPQQYAAAALLQQYPFMPQMDLSSMLPPVVASGAQQQSRNDQTNNYADVLGDYNKSYTGGRGDAVTSVASNVAPPPGFSGPPSNVAAAAAAQAAFGIPQGNFTSLFQSPMLPPTYHHQMPLSFMLPNMAGNGQNPVNLQQKLTQPQMFTQSTFDDQNQSSQQQDYGRSAQSGAIQSFNQQQQQQQQQANKTGSAGYGGSTNESKSVYGGGSHGQLSKGTFERSNYTTTATATPPPNQMSGLSQYAPPVAFNPSAHMTGFATNTGYGNAQLQQLSPMAMPGAHMHDARSSGQQSGVKHGGGMQQSKYPGQTGSYGGGWA